ncbi:carbohydrate ABC transporter permease [Cellulomonas sp. Root137]|uniref:carbohydrate ABC transporter permease n=1 Tax=Cellulomonas sp. Root137 TaxID=1736459 RepID=UPI0006F2A936|nr:sugar ABC transporter permease [Cellulomonas sp. Root137]KQY46974.1 sugar ABC transporter permease [Cellulomonas sp. Root137]
MSTTLTSGSGVRNPGAADQAAPRLRRSSPMHRRRSIAAWGMAAPFVLFFLVFTAWPVVSSLFMSVTDLKSRDLQNPFAVNLVGFENFSTVLTDPLFQKAALNTLYFVVVGVPLTILLALAIALALNTGITKLSGFFRVGYYLPVVTSIVAVAVVWRFLLQPENGLINEVLGWFGIQGPDWLGSTTWAMPSLIAMSVWRSLGTLVVIFLAGLQSVPKALHEASALDGANAWQRLRNITLPTLRPTMLFAGVITGIGFLQFFEEPFVMTQGGPLNSTLSVAYLIYNTFGFGNYGVAAAMSYVLFAAVVLLTVIQFKVLGERDDATGRRRWFRRTGGAK